MKPKTTLILALVLIVLVGVASLFETNRRKQLSSAGKPIFSAFTIAKADGIEIRGPGVETSLRKEGDRWLVATEGNQPADPKPIKQILEAMDKFTSSTLISTSAAKQTEFEVDSTGFSVRITGGGRALAAYQVGRPGPDYMSTYVRPSDRNEIYLVPAYLRTVVDRGEDSWRNKTILEVAQADITGYSTHNVNGTVNVEKQADGSWQITEPLQAKARGDIVGAVLRSLATVKATDFADSTLTPEAAGLEPDTAKIVIRMADGSSHTIRVGAVNATNQSYTLREGDPQIYLVPRGRWNTVLRRAELLREATEADLQTAPPVPSGPGGR